MDAAPEEKDKLQLPSRSKTKSRHRKSSKKRHHHSSSSSSSDSDSSDNEKRRHKRQRKMEESSSHKSKKKSKKKKKKKLKRRDSNSHVKDETTLVNKASKSSEEFIGPSLDTMFTSNMKPMTKEEWEQKQSVMKRVYDSETGRLRLIKGDGEILEEIVNYKQHQEINKKATAADGAHFRSTLGLDKT